MATSPKLKSIPATVSATVILAVVLLLLFVWPYIGIVLLSVLIAFVFNPVYHYILRKTKRNSLAVTGVLATAALTAIIPITVVLLVTIGQVNTMVDQLSNGGSSNIQTVVNRGVERVNSLLTLLPGGTEVQLDKQEVTNTVKDAASSLLDGLVSFITSAGSAAIGLISTSILAIFLIASMLKYQDKLLRFLKQLSPFDDSINNLYLSRAAAMTMAMVKGQLVIATIQGTLSAASLWLVGFDYFWFFLTILIFLSFIPLGGGIVTITIGVIMMLSGNILPGLFLILFHVLVVTNVDNILRPRLVPEAARLDPALLLLAVFSGVALFGAIGVVFGPVAMILIISSLEVYAHYNRGRKRPKLLGKAKVKSKPKNSLFAFVRRLTSRKH